MQFGDDVVMFQIEPFSLVGNFATGCVIGLTPSGAKVCEQMFASDVPDEEIALVDEGLLQQLKAGAFAADSKKIAQKRMAYLHVTAQCNLHCAGCYSAMNNKAIKRDLSFDELCHIINALAQANVARLAISGGEPFLRTDLPALVRYAKEVCRIDRVDILTNGTCIKDSALYSLRSFVDRICISFDGVSANDEAHIRGEQRFEMLVDTVKRIDSVGINVHIIPTIHTKNCSDIQVYASLAKKLNATMNYSLLSAPFDEGLRGLLFTEKSLVQLAEMILDCNSRHFSLNKGEPINLDISACETCGAGHKNLSVAANGDLYPCHMLHRREFRLGNVLKDDIVSILEKGRFTPVVVDEIEDCSECDVRYLCGGGCRARAVYETGTIAGKDPYCALMKTFYRKMFKEMAERYLGEEV